MPEVRWDGKYDEAGRVNAPVKVSLPFQTIETANESAQDRQRSLDLFQAGRTGDWRNRLIWGDRKYVGPALLAEFAAGIDLIYIDPPFDTGADFSIRMEIDGGDFIKEPTVIEQKAYRDAWGVGPAERARGVTHLDRYLRWFYETVVVLHELLSPKGAIYVHLDWHVGHYAKAVLDEVFGTENFRNEIIWAYRSGGASKREALPRKHDIIFLYSKSRQFAIRPKTERQYLAKPFMGSKTDTQGRYYVDTILRDVVEGEIMTVEGDGTLRPFNCRPVLNLSAERTGFPNQKPEGLLSLLLEIATDPGDLVADFFVGSGTTAVVAENLGRRWIAADLSRFAVHTTRKRLLDSANLSPFCVQNLGKYERQVWQKAEFGTAGEEPLRAYRRFILDLYRATPIEGHLWLHGMKAGRLVHVGTVDSPVTAGDVRQIATEFRRTIGTGAAAPSTNRADVLGWDFAFELNEVARQEAALANIDLRFIRIPREVLDKRAIEQGDVSFFELAALSVGVSQKGKTVEIELTDFVIPVDDVPDDIQRAIRHWSQWIDYWAVDWDNSEDTFHNEWQEYRAKGHPELKRTTRHSYDQPGRYRIVVKVIDILGNDTTKILTVDVV